MRAYIWWAVLGGILCALLLGASGASADGTQVHVDTVDTSHLPVVTTTVTVTDSAGLPIPNLPPTAFAASIDGKRVSLSSVVGAADQNLGIGVVLTLDVSGSMAGVPLDQAKSAANQLISQLGPTDQAELIAFSDGVRVLQPFTADKAALQAAVNSLVAGGNTALYQAVVTAYQEVAKVSLPRKAIVLQTDGQDFGGVSQVDQATSLSAASAPGVALFEVGLGPEVDQQYLQQLATASRGRLLLAPQPADLQGLYQSIGSLLRHQYVMTLDVSAVKGGPKSVLHLAVSAGGTEAGADVPLNLPAPVQPVVTPQVTPAPTAVPQPRAQPAAGGGAGWMIPALVGGAVAVGAVVLFVVLRRRRRQRRGQTPAEATEESLEERIHPPEAPRPIDAPLFPEAHPEPLAAPDSWLHVWEDGGDKRIPLSERPITIGFTEDCDIRLPDGNGMRIERVRVWRRDNRYMIHSVSRLGRVFVSGTPVSWAVLEDGDEIQMGSCTLKFESQVKGAG